MTRSRLAGTAGGLLMLASLTITALTVNAAVGDQIGESLDIPLLITVGGDPACVFESLQDAINMAASLGPGNDVIRVARTYAGTPTHVVINNHSVTIEGGYASCSQAYDGSRTTLQGGTGSVLEIVGGLTCAQCPIGSTHRTVILRDLDIRGGDAEEGGGIEIDRDVEVTLLNTAVSNNFLTFVGSNGAGIHIDGSDGASLQIRDGSIISGNRTPSDGGGIYCSNGAVIDFDDGAISFNEADNGGGVYLDNCTFVSRAGTSTSGGMLKGIFGNTAHQAGFGSGHGGGIYAANGSVVELIGGTDHPASVLQNEAGTGGGVFLSGERTELTAHNAWIMHNVALEGGGVALNGTALSSDPDKTVPPRFAMARTLGVDCHTPDRCSSLSFNRAGSAETVGTGGGISVRFAGASIAQTYVEGNVAFGSADVLVGGSAAWVLGGGLHLEGAVLSKNEGAEEVVLLASAAALLAFVTMTGNRDQLFDVETVSTIFGGAQVEIHSSIIWEAGGEAEVEVLNDDGAAEVSCLIVHEDGSLPTGAHITVQDPLLLDPAGGDYHLSSASPAIDYCDTTAYSPVAPDIDGELRGLDQPDVPDHFPGAIYDIGADELTPGSEIFSDGFESGDTSAWSLTVP